MAARKKPEKAKVTDESRSKRKGSRKSERRYIQMIFRDWCKNCGICSAFCPKKVICLGDDGAPVIVRPDDCIGCRFCELHCPDFAITIIERQTEKEEIRA
ncbi:MAG: 4Fe-4S binding protein [Deltaproteobacteria bacterium]|nr:4Fe-4S binding protein [Deltaproteobacteria bacterium]